MVADTGDTKENNEERIQRLMLMLVFHTKKKKKTQFLTSPQTDLNAKR